MGLKRICELFGISRQAYYQQLKYREIFMLNSRFILAQVHRIRLLHPRMGGRKLYSKLQFFLANHQIKMGRDAFFKLLATNGLLINKKRKRIVTTNSYHRFYKYPNLIKHLEIKGINQLWVSDITYLKTTFGFAYISLITDAYSRKIIGYNIASSLHAINSISALNKALETLFANGNNYNLIHHSDRGLQYCSDAYSQLLLSNNIRISMTQNSEPLDNSIAERINGILKNEYMQQYKITTIQQAKALLNRSIDLYNNDRPHLSLAMFTPEQVHQNPNLKFEPLWKNYYQNYKL